MHRKIVVMGVTSTGKSLIAAGLAEHLGGRFVEGDDLHPQSNVDKMAAGQPLTDEDRWPWLDRVGQAMLGEGIIVVACSALRRAYRDRIRAVAGPVTFVHLTGPREVIEERMGRRKGHFMPVSLLDSQLETLEPPGEDEDAITLDLTLPPDDLLAQAVERLGFSSR